MFDVAAQTDQTVPSIPQINFAHEAGIKWVPNLEALAETYAVTKDELYFIYDGHLTAAGNQVIAEIAYDAWKPVISAR